MTAIVELRFTDVGEGLTSGEVVELLVEPGATVARDQPLVAVETDKSVVELPSPVAGVVRSFSVAPGVTVAVGDVLVVIEPADVPSNGTAPPSATAQPAAAVSRPKAAPAVRKLAVELGVDLAAVAPTGPDGRVTADDVRAAATPTTANPELVAVGDEFRHPLQRERRVGWAEPGPFPLLCVRKRTAEAMARSWSTIPHITGMDEVDATALIDARDRLRAVAPAGAPRISVLPLLVKAVAAALARFPLVNATIDESGAVTVHDRRNVGVAVASDDGLVVPVVDDADVKPVLSVATEIAALAERARTRHLSPSDLTGGTCTVTNYGVFGGRLASPIIRPPEVAIVGFGAVALRPLVVDGRVEARPALPICISADHRLVDGELLAAFTADIVATVAEPLRLLLET